MEIVKDIWNTAVPNFPTHWYWPILALIVGTFIVQLSSGLYRWCARAITSHDISALVFLGEGPEVEVAAPYFRDVPVYLDDSRFYIVGQSPAYVNNNINDILGFVEGTPKKLISCCAPPGQPEGWYAHVVLDWQRKQEVRKWAKRGYQVQMNYPLRMRGVPDLRRSDTRFLAVTTFGQRGGRFIEYEMGFMSMRLIKLNPYKKYGFVCDNPSRRQLSVLCIKGWFRGD